MWLLSEEKCCKKSSASTTRNLLKDVSTLNTRLQGCSKQHWQRSGTRSPLKGRRELAAQGLRVVEVHWAAKGEQTAVKGVSALLGDHLTASMLANGEDWRQQQDL